MIIRHRNFFFIAAGIITVVAIAALAFYRLPLSIEFTGGSVVEIAYTDARPSIDSVKDRLAAAGYADASVREAGENGIVIKTPTLSPEAHDKVLMSLTGSGTFTEMRFNSIGPSLGAELANKALWAIAAVILAIVLYIAFAFRKVSRPVSSWIYGSSVVLILLHDVIVAAGFYAIWAHFSGAQADSLFVVAILAILGYSVNDTIVIFDRVRENLAKNEELNVAEKFETVVDRSVMETMSRSINTSLTVVLALAALLIFGSEATFNFALVLIVGVIVGTYSSILVAAPLLVPLAARFAKKS